MIKNFLESSKEDDKKIIDELAKEVKRLSSYAPKDNETIDDNNNDNDNNNETISLLHPDSIDKIVKK